MDMGFFTEYTVPLIVGICLCFGYILKNIVSIVAVNKLIPAIMGITGILINVWIHASLTPEILLAGLFSGLASTGLHQVFHQLISAENTLE